LKSTERSHTVKWEMPLILWNLWHCKPQCLWLLCYTDRKWQNQTIRGKTLSPWPMMYGEADDSFNGKKSCRRLRYTVKKGHDTCCQAVVTSNQRPEWRRGTAKLMGERSRAVSHQLWEWEQSNRWVSWSFSTTSAQHNHQYKAQSFTHIIVTNTWTRLLSIKQKLGKNESDV